MKTVRDLWLFPRESRKTTADAAACNPALRIKRWRDPLAAVLPPSEPYAGFTWLTGRDVPGAPLRQQLGITNAQAAALNLPGAYAYQKWSPAPSRLYYPTEHGSVPVPAELLSTHDEAVAMREELRAAGIAMSEYLQAEDPANLAGRLIRVMGETRSQWMLVREGFDPAISHHRMNVAQLLEDKYQQGIGAPGAWYSREDGTVGWFAEINNAPSEWDIRDEVPFPCMELREDEMWISPGMIGSEWTIGDRILTPEDRITALEARVAALEAK